MIEESIRENDNLKYTLKRSTRSSSVRLAIYRDGRFVVTAPQTLNQNFIDMFITQKLSWIRKKLLFFKNQTNITPTHKVLTKKQKRNEYIEYKEKARILVHERLKYFNQFYSCNYNDVRIKNVSSRWGSCSKKGNLNFSYKLALLPQELSDYVIVHELCHLKELNHSKNFWDLVAKTVPDFKERRALLKKSALA